MKKIVKILFLPVISISLFALVYVQELSPKLGLDLQGGISVILTADEGTEQELIEQEKKNFDNVTLEIKTINETLKTLNG